MTTFHNDSIRDTTIELQEEGVQEEAKCHIEVSSENEQKVLLGHSRTHYVVDDWNLSAGLTVSTRKDRIAVPLDIAWTIQRAKNLWANKVRPTVETSYEGSGHPIATCRYEIK